MRHLRYPKLAKSAEPAVPVEPVTQSAAFRACAAARGHTLTSLARAAGVTRATVHRALVGETIGPRTALRIADALGIDIPTLATMVRVEGCEETRSDRSALLAALGGEL